jgi:hypothetical protein
MREIAYGTAFYACWSLFATPVFAIWRGELSLSGSFLGGAIAMCGLLAFELFYCVGANELDA